MKVELVHPDPDTEPRHWVRHDQAFAMMLGPGSIEWGSKRSATGKVRLRSVRSGTVRSSSGRVGRTHDRTASATRNFRCGTDSCL